MGLSEKQAWVIGGGALAALYLLKHKTGLSPAKATLKAKAGSPTGIASSAQRSSTNLATKSGTSTSAQPPSTLGRIVQSPPFVQAEKGLAGLLAKLFGKQPTAPTRAPSPTTQPKSSPSSSGNSGGGSGGGSSQAQRQGYQAPGGNPWSPSGDFTGRSSVTSDYTAADYYTIDPNTGMPYEDQGPQLSGSLDPDGSASDDPSAIEYVDAGPQMPVGYDPNAGTYEDQGPSSSAYWDDVSGTYVDPTADPIDYGPVDTAPLDSYETTPSDGYYDDWSTDYSYVDSGGGDSGPTDTQGDLYE